MKTNLCENAVFWNTKSVRMSCTCCKYVHARAGLTHPGRMQNVNQWIYVFNPNVMIAILNQCPNVMIVIFNQKNFVEKGSLHKLSGIPKTLIGCTSYHPYNTGGKARSARKTSITPSQPDSSLPITIPPWEMCFHAAIITLGGRGERRKR